MNDYRNFQRKNCKKKGSNFNKHCKGKESIKQKNKYSIIISNKYKQIEQVKHSQRCDKFFSRSISLQNTCNHKLNYHANGYMIAPRNDDRNKHGH